MNLSLRPKHSKKKSITSLSIMSDHISDKLTNKHTDPDSSSGKSKTSRKIPKFLILPDVLSNDRSYKDDRHSPRYRTPVDIEELIFVHQITETNEEQVWISDFNRSEDMYFKHTHPLYYDIDDEKLCRTNKIIGNVLQREDVEKLIATGSCPVSNGKLEEYIYLIDLEDFINTEHRQIYVDSSARVIETNVDLHPFT